MMNKNRNLFSKEEVEKILKERINIEMKIISYYSRALDIACNNEGLDRMTCLNQAIHEIDGKKEENEKEKS